MKDKRLTTIDKSDTMTCWTCNGVGYVNEEKIVSPIPTKVCPTCKGSGKWVETHFILVDEKNKIAFDTDNAGA